MHSKAATRRRHGAELKAKVLTECDEPGASVAAVAQSHGLNANLVHKWRRERRPQAAASEEAPVDDPTGAGYSIDDDGYGGNERMNDNRRSSSATEPGQGPLRHLPIRTLRNLVPG